MTINETAIESNVTWKRASAECAIDYTRVPQYNTAHVNKADEADLWEIKTPLIDALVDRFKQLPDYRDDWMFLSVQRYDIGDYIPPHEDIFMWHYLLVLNNSDVDGLVLENLQTGRFEFHADRYDNMIKIEQHAQHWINPVRDHARYTAVIAVM